MKESVFNEIVETRVRKCLDVLLKKAEEYATEDRLHNFKAAANLQGCTSIRALGGMMCKHTVSVYDLINRFDQGLDIPLDLWEEKIGDSINYLLLLSALVHEYDDFKLKTDSSETESF